MNNITELIKRRRFQLALHSTIYYSYNKNIVPDHVFDSWSEELRTLQAKYPKESKEAPLYDVFKDWDGSTGFHLVNRTQFEGKALYMLRLHESKRR